MSGHLTDWTVVLTVEIQRLHRVGKCICFCAVALVLHNGRLIMS